MDTEAYFSKHREHMSKMQHATSMTYWNRGLGNLSINNDSFYSIHPYMIHGIKSYIGECFELSCICWLSRNDFLCIELLCSSGKA